MSKYGLHGKLVAQKGKGETLTEILLQAAELVDKTGTCHLYLVAKDENNPVTIWITEMWDSKEAHDQSLQNEEIRALIMTAIPLLNGQPEKGQELQFLGGLGFPC